MALEKTVGTPFGIVASYHKITYLEGDYLSGEVSFRIGSWCDVEARMEGKQLLESHTYSVELATLPSEANPRSVLYEWLKQQPEWESANDV